MAKQRRITFQGLLYIERLDIGRALSCIVRCQSSQKIQDAVSLIRRWNLYWLLAVLPDTCWCMRTPPCRCCILGATGQKLRARSYSLRTEFHDVSLASRKPHITPSAIARGVGIFRS